MNPERRQLDLAMSSPVPILPHLSAESLAQSILAAHKHGNLEDAEVYGRVMWQRYTHVPESGVLLAQTLVRRRKPEHALKVWDQVISSNPLNSEWLTQGIRLATVHNADEMLQRWVQMIRRIFIQPPPAPLLHTLQTHGCDIIGSVGIHCGHVLGWTWLPEGEKLQIQPCGISDLGGIESTTRAHGSCTLTTFQIRLPVIKKQDTQKQFSLRFSTSAGADLPGSPLVCESSRSVYFPSPESSVQPHCAKKVTVVVPVYDDFRATKVCLVSLLYSRRSSGSPFNIFIVWDHGPDPKLFAWLQRLAHKHDLTLLSTPNNLGFLGTVNHALRHVGSGDVVLLNADTIVHGNWLERMQDIRLKVDNVGTITPMSSCAEQVSFPHINNPASVTTLGRTARLDRACQQAARKKVYHDLPVGVGFCMYITQELLHRAGGFDGHWLYNGYGEEVDLCLRARKFKMRNLVALNVFVTHLGNRSFGPGKKALVAQNNRALSKRYPDYYAEYRDFMRIDPLRFHRQKISHQYCNALNATVHVLDAGSYADPTLKQVLQRINASAHSIRAAPLAQDEYLLQPCNTVLLLVSRTAGKIFLHIKIHADIQLSDMHLALPRNQRRFRDLVQRLSPVRVLVHGCSELLWHIAAQLQAPCELVLQSLDSSLAHAYHSKRDPRAILPEKISRIQCHSPHVAAWLRDAGYTVVCIGAAKTSGKKKTKNAKKTLSVRPLYLKAKGPRTFAVPMPRNLEQWRILTAFARDYAHAGVVCYVYGIEYTWSTTPRPGNVRPVPGYVVAPVFDNDKVLEPFMPAGILLFPDDPEQHALWSKWGQEHKLPCFIFPELQTSAYPYKKCCPGYERTKHVPLCT